MRKPLLVLALLTGLVSACEDTNIITPTGPSNTGGFGGNDPNGSPFTTSVIEYRVSGNAVSARVRHSNSQDGLTQITTTLPFIVNISTQRDSLFLSLEATPSGYSALTLFPFMSVQIFVNGDLFREATTNDFFLSPISVSGTWRR